MSDYLAPVIPLRRQAFQVLRDVVLDAAGSRCQCTGECGHSHDARPGLGRCCAVDLPGARLLVAPAAPAVPAHVAAALPASQLRAWCAPCVSALSRVAAAAVAAAYEAAQMPLWGGDPA